MAQRRQHYFSFRVSLRGENELNFEQWFYRQESTEGALRLCTISFLSIIRAVFIQNYLQRIQGSSSSDVTPQK